MSASLLDLEVNFSEVLEPNLGALALRSWSSFTFASSKMEKEILISVSTTSSLF